MTLKDRYKEFAPENTYHIYNRGVGRNDIFLDSDDYIEYLKRLRKFFKFDWKIICYCLMPNHLHFCIKQISENPIHNFVKSLHTSYVYYFNKKYDRVGPLFQDRFKARIVKTDEEFVHLSRYIHLNPLISKLVKRLDDYQWSSYLDYIGKRNGTLCDKKIILDLVSNNRGQSPPIRGLSPESQYEKFVCEEIKYAKELHRAKEIAKIVDNCL